VPPQTTSTKGYGKVSVNELLSHIVQAAALGVAAYIGHSVNRLNREMAVYIEKMSSVVKAVGDHEERLRDIESRHAFN
jgi:hypothetical protein